MFAIALPRVIAISELSPCSFCSCLPVRNMIIHKDESWLTQEVKQAGYNNVSDIFLGEYISGQLRLTGYSNHQKGSK